MGDREEPTAAQVAEEAFLAINRERWDELAEMHPGTAHYDLAALKAGKNPLWEFELAEVGDVSGRSMLHLQCHIGTDTLAWARLGAQVTGVDFSEKAIAMARSLASDWGVDASFVISSVYDLPQNLEGGFDIVYTSRGVIGWLPDLQRWGRVIAHFLKPGGFFYITEVHPILQVMDDRPGVSEAKVFYPYFHRTQPLVFETPGSYADPGAEVKNKLEIGWVHNLGDVVNALVANGLRIDFLHEFPFTEREEPILTQRDDGYWEYPGGELPLTFSLKATKR